jgi:hypothetical protein
MAAMRGNYRKGRALTHKSKGMTSHRRVGSRKSQSQRIGQTSWGYSSGGSDPFVD